MNVMIDDAEYYYLEKILRNIVSQNVQSIQEVKAYLNQLTLNLGLINQDGGLC